MRHERRFILSLRRPPAEDNTHHAELQYATSTSTKSGHPAIIFEGHILSLHRKSDNFAFWRCCFKTCRYRVKTNADLSVASVVCTHDHPPKAESLSTSEDVSDESQEVSDESREVSDESKWEIYVSRHEKECLRIDNYCYYKNVIWAIVLYGAALQENVLPRQRQLTTGSLSWKSNTRIPPGRTIF